MPCATHGMRGTKHSENSQIFSCATRSPQITRTKESNKMKTYRETIDVQSNGLNPTFHDITAEVKKIFENSGIQNRICVVYSHHTTCSVATQECSHDKTYFGHEFLQQDLCNIMEN